MVRIAAVGDVHLGPDTRGRLRPALLDLPQRADLLLLAGDLTRHGTVEEAAAAADEFDALGVPVIAVLGNHDYHCDLVPEVTTRLERAGITVLEATATCIDVDGVRVGVAGVKGFGGGFAGKCASAFGEPEMRLFAACTESSASGLDTALGTLDCDLRIALTHFAPIPDTLQGEPPEIHPFLGSYRLGEAIDAHPTDLAVHGHAHSGRERGTTPAGVPVRNVAQPVIRAAFAIYHLTPSETPEPDP